MPHSPEVAEALERSIQHWRENRDVKSHLDIRAGSGDCALCGLFSLPHMSYSDRCWECPVMVRTGKQSCESTPYDDVYDAYCSLASNPHTADNIARWLEVCDREIAFLESLRDPPTE